MKNRYTPFGYRLVNGSLEVDGCEAQAIRKTFQSYLAGKTLRELAIELTKEGINYLPGKHNWDKCRVARMIANPKYCGDGNYPIIINKEDFDKAQTLKAQRNSQKDSDIRKTITPAVTQILCGFCGKPTERSNNKRVRLQQRYICTNELCKHTFCIDDEMMRSKVTHLLSSAVPCSVSDIQAEDHLNLRLMENEIERLLDTNDADIERIRQLIFDVAAEKYRILTDGYAKMEKLRAVLEQAKLPSCNIRKTVMEAVRSITLHNDDTIEITLINGQVLREGHENGTSSNTENRENHTTDHSIGAEECSA